jgi:hypothetical protein
MDAVSHWDRLPDELLVLILSFVPARMALCAVSQRWRRVIDTSPQLLRGIPRSRVLDELQFRLQQQYRTKCECGVTKLRQFVTRFGITAEEINAEGELYSACVSGNLNLARWLVSAFGITVEDMRTRSCYDLLSGVCTTGEFNTMQWLISTFKFPPADVRRNNNMCLVMACACCEGDSRGLKIVQLLVDAFGLTKADVRDCGGLASACDTGHLAIVKWLVSTFGLERRDIYTVTDHLAWRGAPLHCACESGHLDVVRYLVETFGVNGIKYRPLLLRCIRQAYANNHLHVIKYLATVVGLTVRELYLHGHL